MPTWTVKVVGIRAFAKDYTVEAVDSESAADAACRKAAGDVQFDEVLCEMETDYDAQDVIQVV